MTTGRRIPTPENHQEAYLAVTEPGDYCGPVEWAGREVCWFLLPVARDEDVDVTHRGIMHVAFPPHTYRECDDGSLEIRASILVSNADGSPGWHGYLDQGHEWRQV